MYIKYIRTHTSQCGYLSILSEVVMQQLGVGLLVRQDVEERSWCVGSRGCSRVQGPRAPQRRRQVEGGRCSRVETLLVERLRTEHRDASRRLRSAPEDVRVESRLWLRLTWVLL